MTTTDITRSGRVLHPDTGMDAVTLLVGDLEAMASFYRDALILDEVGESASGREVTRELGRGGVPLIRLVSRPELPVGNPRSAGLFHTAFLFADAAGLAAAVHRTSLHPASRFAGSSDHLVSEAFYFSDPEGNGIELYTDRPRASWRRTAEGEVSMDTVWLDPQAYLRTHLTAQALNAGSALAATIGHVHLQVGSTQQARRFYVDTLGFEVTVSSYPGALFASAGGYHHHLGFNTWNSRGAGPRAVSLGLGTLAITVPRREDLDALAVRLTAAGLGFADDGRSVSVDDPWGTEVTLSLPAS